MILAAAATVVAVARLAFAVGVPDSAPLTDENPLLNADGLLIGLALAFVLSTRAPRWIERLGRSSIPAGTAVAGILLAA